MSECYEKRCKLCEGRLEDATKDYCSYCEPTKSEVKVQKAKKKEPKYADNRIFVKLKCTGGCGRTYNVRTTNPEVYTPEVRAKWKCLLCKEGPSKQRNRWQI
jgi:hypothetical protein